MSRLNQVFAITCFAPVLILADFSNDVAYIAEECFTMCHFDAFRGSLLAFAKREQLSDEEMADRLLYIAANPDRFKTSSEVSPERSAIGGLCFFPNAVNALPDLEKYISKPHTRSEALNAFGYITKYGDLFFDVTQRAIDNGTLEQSYELISDKEWNCMATNRCQTEIARVMSLPEDERLNMTVILDAKIAAIEADEARAARRAVWKRRLGIVALALPIPIIALAPIVARRRKTRCF